VQDVVSTATRIESDRISTLISRARADSLMAVLKTSAQARAAARKLGLDLELYTHPIGRTDYPAEVRESIVRLEHEPFDKVVPAVYYLKGQGAFLEWADSASASHGSDWDAVRPRVLEEYRRTAGRRALDAKRAELDSLSRAGWSLDSLAALWGGFHVASGRPLNVVVNRR